MSAVIDCPVPEDNRVVTEAKLIGGQIEEYQNFSHPEHPKYQEYALFGIPPFKFKNLVIRGDLSLNLSELDGFLPAVQFINCCFQGTVKSENVRVAGAEFVNCEFEKAFSMNKSTVKKIIFDNCMFSTIASFHDAVFEEQVMFRSCDFEIADFMRSAFNKPVIFSKCRIGDQLNFEHILVEASALTLVSIPAEKIVVGHADIQKLNIENVVCPKLDKPSDSKVLTEDRCRAWKMKARSLGNEPLASDWHILEKSYMLERITAEKEYLMRIVLLCYRTLSLYGESPKHAAGCLVTFIFYLFTIAMCGGQTWDATLLGIPFFSKAAGTVESAGWKFFLVLYQGIILLQFSLFFFALRNRLRR